ncbi:hypothetical protein Q2K19_01750 [Micromonospora soli]|uniref:hypothetical protein n=1 Tax=Micromonospora sp. NBRC 110009 TaxID=3061627 RepID=UPI002671C74A|nr:hypothetical protein [Micromonospora sp. NBRC 110009]WKT99267.1 hypothetical protein Q2K19_01750 [Micromonospora sp. NBRC 110009]
MQIDSADFEVITTPLPTDWVMRVVIHGSGLVQGGIRMVAEVGPQEVEGLMPTTDEGTILGFLTRQPAPGDELRIGYENQPLTSTGITFEAPNV